jgi:hypothetical protein
MEVAEMQAKKTYKIKFSNNTKIVLTEWANRGIIQISQMRNRKT